MSENSPELSPFEKREVERSERARAHITRRRETALHRNSNRLERLAALCVLLALVAGVAAGRALARSESAPLRVTVFGADQLSPAEIARATGVDSKSTRDQLDPSEIEARLEGHPRITKARVVVTKGRMLIEIRERVAAATALAIVGASHVALAVDAGGTLFAQATADERAQLPRLQVASELALGSKKPELVRGIELAAAVERISGVQLEAVEIAAAEDPAGLALHLRGVVPRFVLGHGDTQAALGRLGTLLDAHPPELANAREVDLRYADQAVIQNTAPVDAALASEADAS
jgi:cell division septal protein FtsQ